MAFSFHGTIGTGDVELIGNAVADATSQATGAIDADLLTAGSCLVAVVSARTTDLAAFTELLTLSGAGLTWTKRAEVQYEASNAARVALFVGTGTPADGALTISNDGAPRACNRWSWNVFEVIGGDSAALVVTSNILTHSGADGVPHLNSALNAMTAGNYTLFCVAGVAAGAHTYTYDGGTPILPATGTSLSYSGYYPGEDTTPTGTVSSAIYWGSIGCEIRLAAGYSPPVLPFVTVRLESALS